VAVGDPTARGRRLSSGDLGLIAPRSGRIAFEGAELAVTRHTTSCPRIAHVPEGAACSPASRCADNLKMAPSSPRPRAHTARSLERVYTLFPCWPSARAARRSMSGGEQQMLASPRPHVAPEDHPPGRAFPRLAP